MNRRSTKKPKKTISAPLLELRKKVAIYIRVSTTHQIDRDSLPMQRKDLIAYATLLLGIDDHVIFEDAGYSGKNTDRPAFQEMMERVRKGEFSHILVWKIDRISRNLLDFAEMFKELQNLRVTFVSKNEQFDTSTAIGEAMLKIILVFAELERNMTAERVTATMISRASNGLWNGGRVPFGFGYIPEDSTFFIIPDEEKVCQIMKEDYIKHKSLVHTSRMLNDSGYKSRYGNDWTPTTVRIVLTNPFMAGIYRYNRYNGTENRSQNPEDEWIMIYDHHPAIYTLEERQLILDILEENRRMLNTAGRNHISQNVHLFSGLAFCGKCGSKMVSTPGRLHANGYRPSNYSCPKNRKSKECTNPTISDTIVGEFVINYILNMLNAKSEFSKIDTPEELQKRLLFGSTFSEIDNIDTNGLNEFFNLLSRYGSDSSFKFTIKKPRKKKATVDPEIEALRKEKEKLERAMKRLQDLFLYSDESMTEKDFIIRKTEISNKLEETNKKLGMITMNTENTLTDEEFIRQASHLLISKELSGKRYIYFKNLAQNVSPEILKTYLETILDSVVLLNGHISSITFKNGLTHKFNYCE